MTAGEPEPAEPPPARLAATPADGALDAVIGTAESDADRALTAIYGRHYHSLVRIAALLAGDIRAAEDIAQDSFVAMHGSWNRLRDHDRALSFLLQFVVSRSRSISRHPTVAEPNAPEHGQDAPSAGPAERSTVGSAIRALPGRQREALVLGFYLDLHEGQIASAMGISRGAVKAHTARGIAALRGVLRS